jgi:hypothetical protein
MILDKLINSIIDFVNPEQRDASRPVLGLALLADDITGRTRRPVSGIAPVHQGYLIVLPQAGKAVLPFAQITFLRSGDFNPPVKPFGFIF